MILNKGNINIDIIFSKLMTSLLSYQYKKSHPGYEWLNFLDFAVITSDGFTCCKGKHFLDVKVQNLKEILPLALEGAI